MTSLFYDGKKVMETSDPRETDKEAQIAWAEFNFMSAVHTLREVKPDHYMIRMVETVLAGPPDEPAASGRISPSSLISYYIEDTVFASYDPVSKVLDFYGDTVVDAGVQLIWRSPRYTHDEAQELKTRSMRAMVDGLNQAD